MPARTFRTSALLVMLALGLMVTACGRRGPLEPPPTAEQIKAEQERERQRKDRRARKEAGQTDSAETPAGDESKIKAGPGQVVVREEDRQTTDQFNPQLIGRPQKTNRAFVIPKRDFILDPLL